jgi:hypothetical protein
MGAEQEFREVQAQWASLDEEVLAPGEEGGRHFEGRSAGATQLRASYQGHEALVDVHVEGNPFHQVSVDPRVNLLPGNRFTVVVNVQALGIPEGSLEYRVVFRSDTDGGEVPWTPMPAGSGGSMKLTSPSMSAGPPGTAYHVLVEARPRGRAEIARYPLSFVMIIDQRVQEQPAMP